MLFKNYPYKKKLDITHTFQKKSTTTKNLPPPPPKKQLLFIYNKIEVGGLWKTHPPIFKITLWESRAQLLCYKYCSKQKVA